MKRQVGQKAGQNGVKAGQISGHAIFRNNGVKKS